MAGNVQGRHTKLRADFVGGRRIIFAFLTVKSVRKSMKISENRDFQLLFDRNRLRKTVEHTVEHVFACNNGSKYPENIP